MERPEKAIGYWEPVISISSYAGIRILRPGDDYPFDFPDGLRLFPNSSHLWSKSTLRKLEGKLGDFYHRAFLASRKYTGGWWVVVRMEEKVRILRKSEPGRIEGG